MQNKSRIFSMDALRAMAMISVILCHASIPYGVKSMPPWPVDPAIHSIYYSYLYIFIRGFCMAVFFVIAGFFARLLYLRIGIWEFIKHRTKRIVLPFFIGIFTIAPLSMVPFIYYKYEVLHPDQGFWEVIDRILPDVFRWNGLVHLWFMYYLILFCVTMLILIEIGARWNILKRCTDFIFMKILPFPSIRSVFILIFPLTLILCMSDILPVEIYTGFTPHLLTYLYFGFFFYLGFMLHRYYARNLDIFGKNSIGFLIIGTLMTPLCRYLYSLLDHGNLSVIWFVLIHIVAATQLILLLFGFLGVFLKFVKSENYALRYIADASYWMYLVHVPIVVILQISLINSVVPAIYRFWIVCFVAIGLSMVSYGLFVRYTFIGNVLNGSRKRRNIYEKESSLTTLSLGKANSVT